MTTTKLILVRHAETAANVARIWQGSQDAPLTARGQIQVAATAEYLVSLHRRHSIAACHASPLPRALSTAQAISQAIGVAVQIDVGLREFNLGDWEGRSFDDLRLRENLWERWEHDPAFAPPNGESPQSFHRRAVAAVESVAEAHGGQTVLLVTHGGIICHVLAHWLGEGASDWRRWDPHNCAVSVLEQRGSGWQGVVINDIGHLPAQAVITPDQSYSM